MKPKLVIGGPAELEQICSSSAVYMPSVDPESLRKSLKETYTTRMQAKVDSGEISSAQVEGIVTKKISKIMDTVKFSPTPGGCDAYRRQPIVEYQLS